MSNWQTSSQWQNLTKSLLIGREHEICQNKHSLQLVLDNLHLRQSDFACPSFNKLAIYQLNRSPPSLTTSSHKIMTPLSQNYVSIMGFMSPWHRLLSARRILTFHAILSTFNHPKLTSIQLNKCYWDIFKVLLIFFCFDLITDGSFTPDFILKILKKFYNWC